MALIHLTIISQATDVISDLAEETMIKMLKGNFMVNEERENTSRFSEIRTWVLNQHGIQILDHPSYYPIIFTQFRIFFISRGDNLLIYIVRNLCMFFVVVEGLIAYAKSQPTLNSTIVTNIRYKSKRLTLLLIQNTRRTDNL